MACPIPQWMRVVAGLHGLAGEETREAGMDGVVFWPPRAVVPGNPRPSGRRIVQIAPWGSYGGTEVLYALCSDGSVWRAARDRDVGGEVVWREVPGIEAVAGGMVIGFTYDPPEPEERLVGTEAPGGSEKQW